MVGILIKEAKLVTFKAAVTLIWLYKENINQRNILVTYGSSGGVAELYSSGGRVG